MKGAIAPTSKTAAKYISSLIPRGKNVLELGAGKGAITKYIRSRTTCVELENLINPYAYHQVRGYTAQEYLKQVDIIEFDYIVSSLPFTLFNETQKSELMYLIAKNKDHDCKFIALNYFKTPNEYSKYFEQVSRKVILKNLPPCIVTEWK